MKVFAKLIWIFLFMRYIRATDDCSSVNNPYKIDLNIKSLNYGRNYLPFCSEMSENSCCSFKGTHQLYSKFQNYLGTNNDPKCVSYLSSALCFNCLPNLNLKICSSFCINFYESCKESFFEFQNNILTGCDDNSIVCSRLVDIKSIDSFGFCKLFHLDLDFNFDTNDDEKTCINENFVVQPTKRMAKKTKKVEETEDSQFYLVFITILAAVLIALVFLVI